MNREIIRHKVLLIAVLPAITLTVGLLIGFFVGRGNVRVVTKEVFTPVNYCPKAETLLALDSKLFANFNTYQKTVVGILDYAYNRPEGNKFDGTGISDTNATLNQFYRENSKLLEERKALLN